MKTKPFRFVSKSDGKVILKVLINTPNLVIHQINKTTIVKYLDYYLLVNNDTLNYQAFETEKDALDAVLDFYESTKTINNQTLF
jgi:hypothetical protein